MMMIMEVTTIFTILVTIMMVIAEICDLTIKVAAVITEWMTISLLGDDDDGDDDGDDDDDDDDKGEEEDNCDDGIHLNHF